MLHSLVHSESTSSCGHILNGPVEVSCLSLPQPDRTLQAPGPHPQPTCQLHTLGLAFPVLPSCFHFSFCRTPSAWLFFSSDIIRNIPSCNCLMVGISPVSRGAQIKPTPDSCPGSAELTRDSCAVESAWHYKELSPRCIIRKEGERWPQA